MNPQISCSRDPLVKNDEHRSPSNAAVRYPGGKGGAGVYQTIINLMPPHAIYIEPFIGGGNIFARKKQASTSIIIDADDRSIDHWKFHAPAGTIVIHGDAISLLRSFPWHGNEFVYCDPPYVMSARSGRKIYRHEFTDQQHEDLLSILLKVPAGVMISGYRCDLYNTMLRTWRRIDFQSMTRGGVRTESLWLNYEPPAVPAELTYIGANYRERERIKRKKLRWAARLAKLPAAERAAILEILLDHTAADNDASKLATASAAHPESGNVMTKAAPFQSLKSVPDASDFPEVG